MRPSPNETAVQPHDACTLSRSAELVGNTGNHDASRGGGSANTMKGKIANTDRMHTDDMHDESLKIYSGPQNNLDRNEHV
jgi:hypothetical protein